MPIIILPVKRDLDLIRKILLAVEESDTIPGDFIDIQIESYSQEEISYHVKLSREAGLVEAVNLSSHTSFKWVPTSLTWSGHEFLDAARSESKWEDAKKNLEKLGNFSLRILLDILLNQ